MFSNGDHGLACFNILDHIKTKGASDTEGAAP